MDKATPERDRDAIVGDLREIYLSDRQYMAEAFRTVPRVVFGRAWAQLDVASLFLQLSLIFLFAGCWGALVALPLLLLADAYRPEQPPAMRRIVSEATFVSAVAFVILEFSAFQALTAWRVGEDPDKPLALSMLLICPLIPPVVCGLSVLFFRFAAPNSNQKIPSGDMLELLAALVLGIAVAVASRQGPLVCLLLLLGACGSAIEMNRSRPSDLAAGIRRLRIRRQLFWLWCAVPMIALHEQLVEQGLIAYRPMLVEIGYVSAGVLFFLGLALGRSCRTPEIRLPDFVPR